MNIHRHTIIVFVSSILLVAVRSNRVNDNELLKSDSGKISTFINNDEDGKNGNLFACVLKTINSSPNEPLKVHCKYVDGNEKFSETSQLRTLILNGKKLRNNKSQKSIYWYEPYDEKDDGRIEFHRYVPNQNYPYRYLTTPQDIDLRDEDSLALDRKDVYETINQNFGSINGHQGSNVPNQHGAVWNNRYFVFENKYYPEMYRTRNGYRNLIRNFYENTNRGTANERQGAGNSDETVAQYNQNTNRQKVKSQYVKLQPYRRLNKNININEGVINGNQGNGNSDQQNAQWNSDTVQQNITSQYISSLTDDKIGIITNLANNGLNNNDEVTTKSDAVNNISEDRTAIPNDMKQQESTMNNDENNHLGLDFPYHKTECFLARRFSNEHPEPMNQSKHVQTTLENKNSGTVNGNQGEGNANQRGATWNQNTHDQTHHKDINRRKFINFEPPTKNLNRRIYKPFLNERSLKNDIDDENHIIERNLEPRHGIHNFGLRYTRMQYDNAGHMNSNQIDNDAGQTNAKLKRENENERIKLQYMHRRVTPGDESVESYIDVNREVINGNGGRGGDAAKIISSHQRRNQNEAHKSQCEILDGRRTDTQPESDIVFCENINNGVVNGNQGNGNPNQIHAAWNQGTRDQTFVSHHAGSRKMMNLNTNEVNFNRNQVTGYPNQMHATWNQNNVNQNVMSSYTEPKSATEPESDLFYNDNRGTVNGNQGNGNPNQADAIWNQGTKGQVIKSEHAESRNQLNDNRNVGSVDGNQGDGNPSQVHTNSNQDTTGEVIQSQYVGNRRAPEDSKNHTIVKEDHSNDTTKKQVEDSSETGENGETPNENRMFKSPHMLLKKRRSTSLNENEGTVNGNQGNGDPNQTGAMWNQDTEQQIIRTQFETNDKSNYKEKDTDNDASNGIEYEVNTMV